MLHTILVHMYVELPAHISYIAIVIVLLCSCAGMI